jgi:NADPH:quinone reductase-like Zn-dependent oxidoreductase
MKAIRQTKYGTDPDVVLQLSEEAKPTVGDDEALVRVHAASVDRGTWHIMTGRPYLIRAVGFGLRKPKARNPGRSFAGTIEACGKEVRAFEAGDAVYGTCDGSFAEYIRGPLDKLARKPLNLS